MTIILNSLDIQIRWSGNEVPRPYHHQSHPACRNMKAIRRSIKGEKDTRQVHHNSLTPKSAIAIVPPKKVCSSPFVPTKWAQQLTIPIQVIKALFDYNPEPSNTQELGFAKGDFFHVISREDDQNWYEACNPLIPSARGLVPVAYFEVIGKTEGGRQSGGSATSGSSNIIPSHDSGYAEKPTQSRQESAMGPRKQGHSRMPSAGRGSGAMVYGIVQYDFSA